MSISICTIIATGYHCVVGVNQIMSCLCFTGSDSGRFGWCTERFIL